MEATKKLEQMIGNTYKYEDKIITVTDVKVKGDFATVETNKGSIQLSIPNLDEELKYFQKKKGNNSLAHIPAVVDMVSGSATMYSQLQETLLTTIEKVQQDPKYIPQAETINTTVKSVIDLEKVKLQSLKLLIPNQGYGDLEKED